MARIRLAQVRRRSASSSSSATSTDGASRRSERITGEGLEFWITNKIREIRDKADNIKHRVGVIGGKDEFKLTDANLVPKQGKGGGGPSMQGIIEQAFPFYKLEEVDLKGGENAIDKDLVGLII